jgi:hypothetical protein
VALGLLLLAPAAAPRAQAPLAVGDRHITYILPHWGRFFGASDSDFATMVAQLRERIGEGPRVRIGLTTYIRVDMTDWSVDISDAAAVRAALASTISQMDTALVRASTNGIPICLSFLTPIRSHYDAAQQASELEDRRNMQWHADNSLAAGWWTHSRYARKQRRIQEAYLRELGRAIAERMALYPETFVAASGDGEVELSYDRSTEVDPSIPPSASLLADYSPFAIAEFRDWLRAAGLYAPGQVFAGEAYSRSSRYAGDPTPADLNADFGTSFDTWSLKHFDWSLDDPADLDPNAIPSSIYVDPGWNPLAEQFAGGFDAPRPMQPGNAWWDVWNEFRQKMLWRHNLEFAKWITTSADAAGNTVPPERWFSDQIPADYLFGFTPASPPLRLHTSASPWWTADVTPYGSLGITAFNVSQGGGNFARTLSGVAPQIAARRVRWGVFEWNPSVPATTGPDVYEQEMRLVELYRPSVLVPYALDGVDGRVLDTPFEAALEGLVDRIRIIPLALNRSTLHVGATSNGGVRTPAQTVRVSGAPGEQPPWFILSASSFLVVQPLGDGRTFSVELADVTLPAGLHTGSVVVASTDPGYSPATLAVSVEVTGAGTSTPPGGSFDTPSEGAVVFGEVAVTGWALDDVGIAGVDIYRSPLAGEPTQPNGLVFVGTATMVEGSRPDVQGTFPTLPMAERAGWGYLLLTNMLPNRGNGTFTLWAIARDYDGHSTTLGSRRIEGTNQSSVVPFGTIDTPAQGATVSGTVVNFGWALTPPGATIPIDGSTITVYVDNVPIGHPVYNNPRSDIASLFPGYANTSGPVGYFMLDTTRYANGVHTISWLVVDSAGRAAGMGSRYFTIANP